MATASQTLLQDTALALLELVPNLGRIADDATRAEGTISPVQARYLHTLLDGPLHGIEIAERLRTTRASVSEVIRRLESARLVRTVPDPADRRARLVEITPAGAKAIEQFGRVTSAAVARVLRRVPPKTVRALRDAARAIAPAISGSTGEV